MAKKDGNIVERLMEYVQIKIEQFKLRIVGAVSRLIAGILAFTFVAVLGILFLFFLSLSLGAFLNTVFDSEFYGYLTVAGFYLLLIIIILVLIKTQKVRGWFEDLLMKTMENEDEPEV